LLLPPGVKRSLTAHAHPGSAIKDASQKKRIQKLRNWIESYQQWRKWSKAETDTGLSIYSDSFSPIKFIQRFLQSKVKATSIKHSILKQNQRAAQRVVGLDLYIRLIDQSKSTFFESYFLGVISDILKKGSLNGIQTANKELKSLILEKSLRIVRSLVDMLMEKGS